MIENIFDYPAYLWIYCLFVAFITGLVFGSFGNAWAYRIVHGERIERGRSHCPVCGHTLSPADLIPLISYMALRGKCRYCGSRISLRYPVAELCCGLAFALAMARGGISPKTLVMAALALIYLVISLTDWESMLIPDLLVGAASVTALILFVIEKGPDVKAIGIRFAGAAALAGGLLAIVLIADRILRKETMGGGDIKLMFSAGLVNGLVGGILCLFAACIIGLAFAILPGATGREGEDKKAFPFGPAICIASYLVMLFGGGFVEWYLGLLKF